MPLIRRVAEMSYPEGFDIIRAKLCAEMINQAYQQYQCFLDGNPWALTIGEIVTELSGTPLGWFAKPEPFGFICVVDEILFIVFRGTVSVDDWLSDANCSQNHYGHIGGVHNGFDRLYVQMAPIVRAALTTLKQVVITGHSLGGALAARAAVELLGADVYTFCAPRVGDCDFAATANRPNAFRVFNTEDIVPTLPLPVGGGIIYQHYGTPIPVSFNARTIPDNHNLDRVVSLL